MKFVNKSVIYFFIPYLLNNTCTILAIKFKLFVQCGCSMFYVHSRDYVSDFDKVYNDYFNFQCCLLCWKSNFSNIWFEKNIYSFEWFRVLATSGSLSVGKGTLNQLIRLLSD